jgi:hypothetical protein
MLSLPDPVTLNERASRVNALCCPDFDVWGIQTGTWVKYHRIYPLLFVESNLRDHVEPSPHLLPEKWAIVRVGRP